MLNLHVSEKEKVLLMLLPFWTPQIPPLGIACLKSYLICHGFDVKTIDANTDANLNSLYNDYLRSLKECIPEEKRGNYYNVAQDVFRNHLNAFLNFTYKKRHLKLLNSVVSKTFFIELPLERLVELDDLVARFFHQLESFILNVLDREKPSVLGLSVFQDNLAASLFAFRITRDVFPEIMTVMGGGIFASDLAPGSPNFDMFLAKTPYIDHIIVGEGEIQFLKLLRNELPHRGKLHTLNDIDGQLLDLDSAPIPDFSDLNLDFYPYLSTYTSRSCPFQCSFCSETVYWGKYRKKAAARVVSELEQLHTAYGGRLFLMGESILNPIVDDLASELSSSGLSLYWDGYLRVDPCVIVERNAAKWRDAGFYRARLGLESGSPHVLDLMGKKISPALMAESLAKLAGAGIKTTTYWVVGHPGETEEDFQQTLDFLEANAENIYEAWSSPFYVYASGQVGSNQWETQRLPLYCDQEVDSLMLQTWYLDCMPARDVVFERVARFQKHCEDLHIPNPFFLYDFHKADERWKMLHETAVPSLAELRGRRSSSSVAGQIV